MRCIKHLPEEFSSLVRNPQNVILTLYDHGRQAVPPKGHPNSVLEMYFQIKFNICWSNIRFFLDQSITSAFLDNLGNLGGEGQGGGYPPSYYQCINHREVKRNYQCINQWVICKFTLEYYHNIINT